MKKDLQKLYTSIFFSLLMIIVICIGCSGKKVPSMLEMTKEDKEFDSYARKSAEDMLEQEIRDITWATVETGDLEYMYTLYNKDEGLYEVSYITKFDESDDPEDEWIIIEITLTEQKHVTDAKCSYMDPSSYETSYGHAVIKSGDDWVNINYPEED